MDSLGISPIPGGGAAFAAPGQLTPKQAGKFFEFFRAGSHREALLLGDLVEQQVHYVKSKGHKVLCAARAGFCELCEKAGESDDVGEQQTEFYAPSFVRPWKEREFHQRVAVFSQAAAEQLMDLIDRDHEGVARGCRVDVSRHTRGTSSRFVFRLMDGLPRGFPSLLPVAFDLVPWIRARFGKRQTPDRPLVILPSFKCEVVNDARSGRPKPLELSASDMVAGPDELERMRAKLAAAKAMFAGRPTEPPADDVPATTPADTPPPRQPAPAPEPVPEPEGRGLGSADGAISAALARRLKLDGRLPDEAYAPKLVAREGVTAEGDEVALTKRSAEAVCDEQRQRSGFLKNGHAKVAANGKKGGGA